MNGRPDIRITLLQRHAERGYWTAHVSADGQTASVDRRYGSWQLTETPDRGRREVLIAGARALQARVRPIERQERAEVQEAAQRELARRVQEFRRDLHPTERDLKRYTEDALRDVAGALVGRRLEDIWSTPSLAWARPASWQQ